MAAAGDPVDGSTTETLPAGLFESFMPAERAAAIAAGVEMSTDVSGSGLFADISGFTPLAEALVAEHGRRRGAEELDSNLNRIYEAIIDVLAAYGGEVLYFSGDAITCWLDGDDGSRAVQCALDMQATMRDLGDIATALGPISLSIKVAVVVGHARRFVVGDPELQLMDVLAGRLIDQLAAAESLAGKGDVIADASVVARLGDRLVTSEFRADPDLGRRCAVVTGLERPPSREPPRNLAELPIETVRPWLIPEVFARLAVGGGVFLGELRSAYPIFMRFGGFDVDNDPDAHERMDEFVRRAQQVLHAYDGTLLGITIGDKGAYVNAVVGALRTHEDDAHRAVAAAMEIRDLEHSTAAVGVQVGVSHGPIYAGTYGHSRRHTYSVLGDPTNTAARLMVAAPPGEVYVLEDVAAEVDDRFAWAEVGPLKLKGKAEPVGVRSPIGTSRRVVRRVTRYELPMVGRDRELAVVRERLEAVRRGARRVVTISADAGMGKSRFVAELLRHVDTIGLPIAYGQAESLGQSTSYVVWRGVWRRIFGLDDEWSDEEQARHVERLIRSVNPSLARRAPLVGTVLGIEFPDNDFVRSFDAKLRKASLENLLGDLLVHRLRSSANVVVLEDLQWIDQPSIDLLVELVRRTADMPVLFLLSMRQAPAEEPPEAVAGLPDLTEVELAELDREGMEAVVTAKATQVFGEIEFSPAMVDLVLDRSQGNPFYAEEIVNYLYRLDVDPSDPAAATIELPTTLNAIVLGRIDALDELPRQAVKVASVAGRSFEAMMLGRVHEPLGGDRDVVEHLEVARAADLVVPEDIELADWLFRHAITREVAYESLPFAVRRTMHERLGDLLADADGSLAVAGVIAHHYWHSDNVDKQRRWLRVAGDAARRSYANEAAIEQYLRLAEVAPESERARVLLDLTSVYELVGDWDTAERTATEARELALADDEVATVGWCDVALAELQRKHGAYDAAVELLRRARSAFESAGDEPGAARVAHLRGTIAAQQGDLAEARRHYEASRVVRERLGDLDGLAALLSNLGVVAEYEGNFVEARRHHERALDLRRQSGDRWAIAVSHTNLGMIAVLEGRHDDARALFDESMRLNAAVGDVWMVAIAHNNLGNAHRGLGNADEALEQYAASLAISRTYGDLWALAFLVEDVAVLAIDRGEVDIALRLLGAADAWRDRIDAPRPSSTDDEIESRLEAIDEELRHTARAAGAAWTDDEALDAAAAYCSGASP